MRYRESQKRLAKARNDLTGSANVRFYVTGPCFVHSGATASAIESALGMYGLMSATGDPSMASSPLTVRTHPSSFVSLATHRHMGFGREGLLHANTPTFMSTLCLFG